MILNLSGGVPLNFSVTAYSSASALPSSAPENAIGVITTTAITSYVFSSTQPTSPKAGMVWFDVSTTANASFSATKGNTVMVYPINAQQYVSSAWKSVVAKTYQGGSWKSWFIYLYDSGDKCASVTGGYTLKALAWSSSDPGAQTPTIAYNTDNMVLTVAKKGTTGGILQHFEKTVVGWENRF